MCTHMDSSIYFRQFRELEKPYFYNTSVYMISTSLQMHPHNHASRMPSDRPSSPNPTPNTKQRGIVGSQLAACGFLHQQREPVSCNFESSFSKIYRL